MKHGTQRDSLTTSPVGSSDLRRALSLLFALACLIVGGGTGWILFLGAIGGNWLCIVGWAFGVSCAVFTWYFVSGIKTGSETRR